LDSRDILGTYFLGFLHFFLNLGLPAHIREALPAMDWMGGDFTPSPLIDPRRTFLASLVLASKFLLDKAFSNKAWAKSVTMRSLMTDIDV
jgi:hypothetical protein